MEARSRGRPREPKRVAYRPQSLRTFDTLGVLVDRAWSGRDFAGAGIALSPRMGHVDLRARPHLQCLRNRRTPQGNSAMALQQSMALAPPHLIAGRALRVAIPVRRWSLRVL